MTFVKNQIDKEQTDKETNKSMTYEIKLTNKQTKVKQTKSN
jgi:hypothetical protein